MRSVFDVENIPQAKSIILTPEDSTTEKRWEVETPYLGAMIADHLALDQRSRVLDYGCGIGRLAKEMISRTGCQVTGVDTSRNMRSLASIYVADDRFFSCHPDHIDGFYTFDHAIAVWTLQHIEDVGGAISQLQQRVRGKVFVVNMVRRAVPTAFDWQDDGKDVWRMLRASFDEIEHGALDPVQTTPMTATIARWGVYHR